MTYIFRDKYEFVLMPLSELYFLAKMIVIIIIFLTFNTTVNTTITFILSLGLLKLYKTKIPIDPCCNFLNCDFTMFTIPVKLVKFLTLFQLTVVVIY